MERRKSHKRKRVTKACVFCHRSHLMCDSERPCERCQKRNISHLCRDEEESMHTMYQKLLIGLRDSVQEINKEEQQRLGPENTEGTMLPTDTVSSPNEGRRPRYISYLETFSGPDLANSVGEDSTSHDQWEAPSMNSDEDTNDALHSHTEGANSGEEGGKMKQQLTMENIEKGGSTNNRLLKYTEDISKIYDYCSVKLTPGELLHWEKELAPIRDNFLQTLLLLDCQEMLLLKQSFERKMLSLRKYFNTLNIPGLVLRRVGEVCLISDPLAEMLGFHRDEIIMRKHMHEMIPASSLHSFIDEVALPMLRPGGSDTMVYDLDFVHADGSLVHTRSSLTIQRGIHNIPICMIALVFPINPPPQTHLHSSLEVVPSTFNPSASSLDRLLFHGIEPGSGLTIEDVQDFMGM